MDAPARHPYRLAQPVFCICAVLRGDSGATGSGRRERLAGHYLNEVAVRIGQANDGAATGLRKGLHVLSLVTRQEFEVR